MSSRQLRKLQKQQELQKLEAQNPAEDDESTEDERPTQKPRASLFSGFAALGDQDEDEEEGDVEDKEDESVEATQKHTTEPDPITAPIDTPKTNVSKKSKSKKKKKKAKKQEVAPNVVDTGLHNEQDEIDRALRELALKQPHGEPQDQNSSMKVFERICELLSINTYHLKVINEMRNLFGREAIAAAHTEEEQDQARSRRQQHVLPERVDLETFLKGQPGKSLSEVTLRRNPFLAGKENWPNATTEGLTMDQIKQESESDFVQMPGTAEFRFVHNGKYNALEEKFWQSIQMFEPLAVVYFLHAHPYHISSLIQVSRIAKQDQNSALSADLCERALFTFGRISLSGFRQKLEQGKARLSFKRPENRQFWLAGYHYLKNLIMKGTYRTALEWCKLLLSINHADPYGIIHFIHPLAIRAHESKWFIDLCESGMLDVDPEAQDAPDYIRQTLVLARLQQKDTDGAKKLVIEGMERLPWLYGQIFKSLSLDVPKSLWGWQPRNHEEDLHTNVYIHQTKGLWDNAQATSLLKEAAKEVKRADPAKAFAFPPPVKTNFARFVYLLEVPSLIGLVPRGLLETKVNWEFDPLPPPLEENIFSHSSQTRPWIPGSDDRGLDSQRNLENLLRNLEDARRDNGLDLDDDEDLDLDLDEDEEGGEDDVFVARPDESPTGGINGVFQAFLELLMPRDLNFMNSDDGMGADDDSALRGMPGHWYETDSADEATDDDKMPPLIPEGNSNDANTDEDDMPDDLPPLVPIETSSESPQTPRVSRIPSRHRRTDGDETDTPEDD
ncbi:DUF654-domain-containing protein [Hypoxylon rubiginosum]|uniref:DUF654-domain-containing protein n=1 Tax=Hypoxylon rubiginosum TaxID=110542 RepID=A0ACB9YL71_9PEZI|nr:DUF654-domain-containing protein [Hypoxylon rubiginosum]